MAPWHSHHRIGKIALSIRGSDRGKHPHQSKRGYEKGVAQRFL